MALYRGNSIKDLKTWGIVDLFELYIKCMKILKSAFLTGRIFVCSPHVYFSSKFKVWAYKGSLGAESLTWRVESPKA